ncbi:MAG: maleylacetoacetate isomerase [Wenzhouxiangellaceae bacterium]
MSDPAGAAQRPITLYDYWRSSAAYRVRIALNLKGLEYRQQSVHLVRDGGQQHSPDYVRLNPQHLVPTLIHGDQVLTQSLAIIEYLDECYPLLPLLPTEPLARARCRALAQVIACDVHPLNNLRVLKYLSQTLQVADDARDAWYREWIARGFAAYEELLGQEDGRYSCGKQPSLADCCLVPQVYNAIRYQCDLEPYPRIRAVVDELQQLPAVAAAAPEQQADANQ